MESVSRTGVEYGGCWTKLQREGQQIATFIGKELDGTLEAGAAVAEESRGGTSCRQALTVQIEELREAALREGLLDVQLAATAGLEETLLGLDEHVLAARPRA